MSHWNRISKSGLVLYFLSVLSFSCQSSEQVENTDASPNILLIYIDDLGYSDLACYGEEYGNTFFQTPNIDRLAAKGMKFTQAYASAPLCSPSRAALLTGKSPARLGFEFVTKFEKDEVATSDADWKKRFENFALVPPRYTLNLPLEEQTLAEMLNQQGYETGIVGKWHVAAHHLRYKGWSLTHGPQQQGFKTAIETYGAHPYGFEPDDKKDTINSGFPIDALTESAVEFIQQKRSAPFFLYLSHYYVHTPLDGRLHHLIKKYRSLLGPSATEDQVKYAAFVEMMDHYVGQVLEAVDEAGIAENTLILLTSDNGGHPHFAFNRPFRGSKWNLYEGGIRVPLIATWPGKITPGSVNHTPVIQTDFMHTFASLAGQNLPNLEELDSEDISSLFFDDQSDSGAEEFRAQPMIWHFPYYHPEGKKYFQAVPEIGVEDGATSQTRPQSAIRKGRHKLIYFYAEDRYELYDLVEDPSEQQNIYHDRPSVASDLQQALFEYLAQVNARRPVAYNEFLMN